MEETKYTWMDEVDAEMSEFELDCLPELVELYLLREAERELNSI